MPRWVYHGLDVTDFRGKKVALRGKFRGTKKEALRHIAEALPQRNAQHKPERKCVMIAQERDMRLANRINETLRCLHITGNLLGFYYLVLSIEETVPNPMRIQLITKDLFVDVARYYEVSPASVDRDVRTAINICWTRGGKEALDEMACCHLIKRPSPSEFIDIVADYIRRTE